MYCTECLSYYCKLWNDIVSIEKNSLISTVCLLVMFSSFSSRSIVSSVSAIIKFKLLKKKKRFQIDWYCLRGASKI